VRQMQRDSGRQIRRRAELEVQTSATELPRKPGGMSIPRQQDSYSADFFAGTSMELRTFDTVRTESWFSGAYTYLLADGHSYVGKLEKYDQLANRLLGTRMNADTMYQITPWSWLLDWFADAGSFLSNVSALSDDSLVMKYGYVMHQVTASREYSVLGQSAVGGDPSVFTTGFPVRAVMHYRLTTKERRRATPYGFGVHLEDLSPRRWAVLTALGLTHTR